MSQFYISHIELKSIDRKIKEVRSDRISDFTSENEDGRLLAPRRRSYRAELEDDFDVQQVFKEITWSTHRLLD